MKAASSAKIYRRLASGNRNVWVANDHLLYLQTGPFRETYSRLYWADIQMGLLYSLEQPAAPLVVAEVFSMAIVLAGAIYLNPLRGAVWGVVFPAIYAAWRFTRPRWAARLITELSAVNIPLARSLEQSRKRLDELRQRILSAQPEAPAVEAESIRGERLAIELPVALKQLPEKEKQSNNWVYAMFFVLGLVCGLSTWTTVIYCFVFLIAFFLPRRFNFPLSVSSALVMNELTALFRIASWIWALRYPLVVEPRLKLHQEFTLASTVFCVYGLLTVVAGWRRSGQYTAKSSTLFGLDTPAT